METVQVFGEDVPLPKPPQTPSSVENPNNSNDKEILARCYQTAVYTDKDGNPRMKKTSIFETSMNGECRIKEDIVESSLYQRREGAWVLVQHREFPKAIKNDELPIPSVPGS
jgi:hypothetical protein